MAFLPGDHIFIRRGGVAGKSLVKHHAIVVATLTADSVEIVEHGVWNKKDGTKKWVAGTGIEMLKEVGEVKRRTINLKEEPEWTTATNIADPFQPHAVVERALFVLENYEKMLPAYHLAYCNGECVARWCKTGKFESTQAKGLYDKAANAINDKVAPAMDTSGKAVSRAIAPKSPGTSAAAADGQGETTPKSPSKLESTQQKASSAIQQASSKVVGAVKAVGAMVGTRQQQVFDKWAETNEILDSGFAVHKSTAPTIAAE